MKKELKRQIEGYQEIENEISVLRKYSAEQPPEKDQTARTLAYYHPKYLDLTVSDIFEETETTKTVRLVSENGYLPPFQAGQYINLFLEIDGILTSRPYSISSPPNQTGFLDITIRAVDNGFVSDFVLKDLQIGNGVRSTSPSGNFFYNPLFHGDDLVFIAGGSGITPFMSMIREISERKLERSVHLIYGNRNENDIIFGNELERIVSKNPNIKVSNVISEPTENYKGLQGFITKELIVNLIKDPMGKMFYICGPEAMYSFVLKELEKLEIPRRRIRVEVFGPPAEISKQPGWPEKVKKNDLFQVTLNGSQPVEAVAGEPIMNSLERSGLVLPASCRSGECSLCRTKLLKGKVFQPSSVKIRKSDQKYNYIHPCMAYPLADLELLV